MAIYTSGIICQLAIQDTEDKTISAIRIIDHIEVDIPTEFDPNTIIIAYQVSCFALLSFKSEGPEEFEVEFDAIAPDGRPRKPPAPFKVKTGGGPEGHTLRIGMYFDPRDIGLWWFDVLINGVAVHRIPLELRAKNSQAAVEVSENQPRRHPQL